MRRRVARGRDGFDNTLDGLGERPGRHHRAVDGRVGVLLLLSRDEAHEEGCCEGGEAHGSGLFALTFDLGVPGMNVDPLIDCGSGMPVPGVRMSGLSGYVR